ncbi:hypothetical protein LTR36_007440 [Oleoguttula mirabilis]|uniref:Nudix hydrolase domain-containing protein n=1 Tax=Oleoguttula mirabilis TaxID=1507867 RepID=A0AAV9J9R5_9PEZI|nr:hypothetical protein LTR36_007440 [Oleoguttula mirabilis]
MPVHPSQPVHASFPSERLTIGAGVAIFHVASERAVVCYHTRDKYWFLPKGRRNANEETMRAAEREGFEESGYRNRVLPLPIKHRQPDADEGYQPFVTEPLWTQLLPLTATSQYMLFWYAAETLPPEIEEAYTAVEASTESSGGTRMYRAPRPFPGNMSLRQRIAQDSSVGEDGKQTVFQPTRHEDTGVDEEELLYNSYLLPIDDVMRKLKGTVMEDVVQRGWAGIQLRLQMEAHSGPER